MNEFVKRLEHVLNNIYQSEWDWNHDFEDENGNRHVISNYDEIELLPNGKSRENAKEYFEWTEKMFMECERNLEHAIDTIIEKKSFWQDNALTFINNTIRAEKSMGCANDTAGLNESFVSLISFS